MTIFEAPTYPNSAFGLARSNFAPPHTRAVVPVFLSPFGDGPASWIESRGQKLCAGGRRPAMFPASPRIMDLAWDLSPDGRGRGFCSN